MIQLTYQKANGDIFQRVINTYTPYKIGETTSIGWKVLDIKYRYKNKYYSKVDYDALVEKTYKRSKNVFQLKKSLYNIYKELVYCVILLILLRFFDIVTKVIV